MPKIAFVITKMAGDGSDKIKRILDLFGIPCHLISGSDLEAGIAWPHKYVVLCAVPLFGQLLSADKTKAGINALVSRAESVFLYGVDGSADSCEVFERTALSYKLCQAQPLGESIWTISDVWTLCGPMRGLRVKAPGLTQALIRPSDTFHSLIFTDTGSAFVSAEVEGQTWYIATADVIDISRSVEKGYFDVTDYFLSAVPIVMYLRHTFENVAFQPAEYGACLIVDDPVLRNKYGFVNFQKVAGLADEHNFSCNVAFIPWNWKRSRPSVIKLFKEHADRLSISIHGCDHTRHEFAAKHTIPMNRQAKLAKYRMDGHSSRTGLSYDWLMVFPQGAFSSAAAPVLKHNNFIAAVNTEVAPLDQPNETQIGDTWQMAILRYADFPIFTRRYAFHGIHNFAFDLLLGKPCIVVTHHGDFQNDCRELVGFIEELNALPVALKWGTLGDVIRRAYQMRSAQDAKHVRMFGSEILLANNESVECRIVVEKMESDPASIDHVLADGRWINFSLEPHAIRFELDLAPMSQTMVRVAFRTLDVDDSIARPLTARGKIAARRYLSELRDESQSRLPVVYKCADKARKWLRPSASAN